MIMELWFNTSIPWITKEAVTWVEWTQVQNFPNSAKKEIIEQVKAPQMEKIWRLNPKTNLDDSIASFYIDKISWYKDNATITQEYSGKIPADVLKSISELNNDLAGWYKIWKVKQAYKEFDPELIEDLYDIYHSKYNNSNAMESFAWGVVGKIPKVMGNFIKTAVDNPMTNPTYFVDMILKAQDKQSIWGAVKSEIEKVTKEFAQDVNRWIGWNEEDDSFKVWEFLVEVAPFFINPEIWAEAAVKKLATWKLAKFPWVTNFLQNNFVKKFLQRSMESVVDTSASIAAAEGRRPTVWELAVWVGLQNVIWSRNIKKSNKLMDRIWERSSKGNMVDAIEQWTLRNPESKRKRLWSWQWKSVNPSEKSKKVVQLIKDDIKWWSTKPQKLFNQMKDKIGEYGNTLKEPFKKVNIGTMTSMKKDLKGTLTTFANEVKTYSPSMYNNIKKVVNDIDWLKNLDELWETAIKLDNLMPKSVKKSAAQAWWKEGIMYGLRRDSRNVFNEALDANAHNLPEGTVRETFDKMSSMYHGMSQLKENLTDIYRKTKGIKQAWMELWKTAWQWAILNQMFWISKTDKNEF